MKKEQIECSETSAYNIQTPGNYPEEIMQQSSLLYDVMLSWLKVSDVSEQAIGHILKNQTAQSFLNRKF